MKYSGPDDPELPGNVKDLPDDKRKQWVEVYNQAMSDCAEEADGDDEQTACDGEAAAAANSAVKEENGLARWLLVLARKVGLMKPTGAVKPPAPKERAISISSAYEAIWMSLSEVDPYVWLNDIYYDDGGLFVICSSNAKLFKVPLVSEDGVHLTPGEWIEVVQEFTPVPGAEDGEDRKRTRTTVRQQADGSYRWISVSCAAVLNRSGSIDSRELFDSFIRSAETTGKYPIRQFYHQGSVFRTGKCDFLARDGYLLITSGVYDDTELARREIQARKDEPDFWGDSIGFIPTSDPEMWEVADGITVPVYRTGVMEEVSTLPEGEAASWFTNASIMQEVNRMLDERTMAAFTKLFGGNEDEAKRWLEEHAESRNRQITDQGLLTRNAQKRDADPNPDVSTETPPAPADADGAAGDPPEVILDDAATAAIADAVISRMTADDGAVRSLLNEALSGVETRITGLEDQVRSATEKAEALAGRLEALEADDETKRATWAADLPRKGQLKITHRARDARTVADPKPASADPEDEDLAAIAAASLAKIPNK